MTSETHRSPSRVVDEVHGTLLDRRIAYLNHEGFSTVTHEDRPSADVVLLHPNELGELSLRSAVDEDWPTPVLIVLDASSYPATHVAQCLSARAEQCLVDPDDRELVAHVNAIARRHRHIREF